MRAFWMLGIAACAAGCGEGEPVFSIQLALGLGDAVLFDLVGVSLTDEPAPCNASGGLEVEPTPDNTVVNLQDFTETVKEVRVPAGRYAFFVEGYDADAEKTTQGCGTFELAAGRTDSRDIVMLPFVAEAVCADGIRTGFEQCDDGNSTPGDGCDASCVTEEQQANTRFPGPQSQPAIGVGVPFVFGFRTLVNPSPASINRRALGPNGELRIGSWFGDQELEGANGAGTFQYELPDVGVGGTRYVIAYVEVENLIGGGVERDILATAEDWAEDGDTTVGTAGLNIGPNDDRVDQDSPAVAVQDDGSFAIGWLEGGQVSVATFSSGAAPVAGPTPLGTGGANTLSLGALSDGNYVAAWDRGTAQAQRFDDAATEVGGLITTGNVVADVSLGTSFERDEFALVWIEGDAVVFQAFSQDGTPVGASPAIVSGGGANATPAVSGHAGHWFTVWANGDIWGRYVDSDGTFALSTMAVGAAGPTGDSFQINQVVDNAQSSPGVAMNGNFALVVWGDAGNTAPREDLDRGIRMRVLTEPVL